jgi:DNA-binding response OmpR family regulator
MTRILLVDDHPHIVRLLELALKRDDREILVAHDGEHALEIARRERPDLIILDVQMPGVDGFRVLDRLRQDPDQARTLIVMLTVKAQPEDVTLGLDAGADFYLPKPFKPAEIASLVERALQTLRPD